MIDGYGATLLTDLTRVVVLGDWEIKMLTNYATMPFIQHANDDSPFGQPHVSETFKQSAVFVLVRAAVFVTRDQCGFGAVWCDTKCKDICPGTCED